jgi:hypothetical protein
MEQVLSIDIGVRNLALWIEEFNPDKIQESKESLSNISKKDRLTPNNEPTEAYKTFLNTFLSGCSRTIYADKIDLCENIKISYTKNRMIIVTNEILFNIVKEFDKRRELLTNVKTIVIEKQLKTNPNAQMIQNHIHAYFLHQYGLTKHVEIFDSCYKTRLLGCPRKIKDNDNEGKLKKINKSYRKRWTTNLTRDVLMERKDKKFFDFIFNQNKSKADDLSDTFCQVCAFVLLRFS